jgi:hypothetical protein
MTSTLPALPDCDRGSRVRERPTEHVCRRSVHGAVIFELPPRFALGRRIAQMHVLRAGLLRGCVLERALKALEDRAIRRACDDHVTVTLERSQLLWTQHASKPSASH